MNAEIPAKHFRCNQSLSEMQSLLTLQISTVIWQIRESEYLGQYLCGRFDPKSACSIRIMSLGHDEYEIEDWASGSSTRGEWPSGVTLDGILQVVDAREICEAD